MVYNPTPDITGAGKLAIDAPGVPRARKAESECESEAGRGQQLSKLPLIIPLKTAIVYVRHVPPQWAYWSETNNKYGYFIT